MRKIMGLSLVFCLGIGLTASVRAEDPKEKAAPAAHVKKPGAVFKVLGSATLAVALSPDGKILARAGTSPPFGPLEKTGQTVDLWDVASGKKLHTLTGHTEPVVKLAFSLDGKTLASSTAGLGLDGSRREMKLWDVASGKERAPVGGQRKNISFGAFSPDGKTLATSTGVYPFSGDPAVVKLWDLATGTEKMELGVGASLVSLAFSPDGKNLAMGVRGDEKKKQPGSVQLWDLTTGKKRASMPGGYWDVGFTPDGRTLVSVGFHNEPKELNSQLTLWDVATTKERVTIPISGPAAMQVAPPMVFTADGKTLITTAWIFEKDSPKAGGPPEALRIRLSVQHWDLATGKARATFWTPVNPGGRGGFIEPGIWFSALSADGKTVAWGGRDGTGPPYIGTAHVWEVESLATTAPELPKEFEKPAPAKPLDEQGDKKPADAPKENAAKKEMEKLQGTWQLVEGETFFQGRAIKAPKEEIEMEKVIIKGDNWTYRPAKGPDEKARFQLGATKESKTIDLVWTDGEDKGKTYPGVFTLDGDTLKICYAREGKVRPSGFTAEATKEIKDHCVLMVLKREKR